MEHTHVAGERAAQTQHVLVLKLAAAQVDFGRPKASVAPTFIAAIVAFLGRR
jgi:hypothetical protein